MVFQLASSDVNAALELVNKYASGQMKENACKTSARNGPKPIRNGHGLRGIAAELEWADQFPAQRQLAMFNSDPTAAVQWLKNLPDDSGKNQIIEGVSYQWAQSDLTSPWPMLVPWPPVRARTT